MTKPSLDSAKRIVVKIGSALLVNDLGLASVWLDDFVEDIAMLASEGKEVILVSSGSIALGRRVLGFSKGPLALAEAQASAAVGQIELAKAYQTALSPHKLTAAQVLVTSEDSENRRRYLNTQSTLRCLIDLGAIPIVNENDTVATDEIRFGDNDRLAAQVAVMAGADLLVLLSDIDGIYTENPRVNKDAKHIEIIDEITPKIEAMAGGAGTEGAKGGMITKVMAAKTATHGGVAMAIVNGSVRRPLKALRDGAKASWFVAKSDAEAARKLWITSMKTRGEVMIDEGARLAIYRGSSLLAAGVTSAIGRFHRGDAIDVKAQDGVLIGRGLAAYDFDEMVKILKTRSQDIEEKLGYAGRGAAVHRDNFVLLQNEHSDSAEV